MIVTVNKANIERGRPGVLCPVWLALKDSGLDALVRHDRIVLLTTPGRECDEIPLPNRAKKFIKAFDHGRKAEPFDFEVNI